MKVEVKTRGFNSMTSAIAYMARLGAKPRGVSMLGRTRNENGNINNSDVIQYLKDGGRDTTLTKEDSNILGGIVSRTFMERLRILTASFNKGFDTPKGLTAAKAQGMKVANAAASSALMAAGRRAKEIILERLENSQTNDGNQSEVTIPYAQARASKYGVPNDTSLVFKASGQLIDNVSSGFLKLHK